MFQCRIQSMRTRYPKHCMATITLAATAVLLLYCCSCWFFIRVSAWQTRAIFAGCAGRLTYCTLKAFLSFSYAHTHANSDRLVLFSLLFLLLSASGSFDTRLNRLRLTEWGKWATLSAGGAFRAVGGIWMARFTFINKLEAGNNAWLLLCYQIYEPQIASFKVFGTAARLFVYLTYMCVSS